ncbi:MAG: DUF421 domain-containing protein [Peptococcaceae bacterium]|nr:DUF421 domain-containing protein [Peptococcaceae bacterium]
MLAGIFRTTILYLIVVLVLRLMGKRQIAQLQPFELVIILMISELAAVPSEDVAIPLISGLLPVLVLFLLGVTISQITLKSEKARAFICGTPTLLINKGHILESELRRLRYSISDLMEQLRAKDMPNIADVEYAILETNGDLSVIPKVMKRPATPEDLNLQLPSENLASTLIMDGILQDKNFPHANVTEAWLMQELKKAGIKDYRQVLIASVDGKGQLYVQAKSK